MLERCLSSLRVALDADDELIVVDSLSRDADAVRRVVQAEAATYVRAPAAGASVARNAGWRAARHDVVAFVDDDVFVSATWAAGARQAFAEHRDAVFVTGRIEVPPEQGLVARPVAIKDDAAPHVIDRAFDGIVGHSANLAVRTDALARVGGFDRGMGPATRFPGAEDLDLFDRLLATGGVGWYAPAMNAWHDQWRTSRDLLRLDWRIGRGMGARVAKLQRTDRQRARSAAKVIFWSWGLWDAYRWARARSWVLVGAALLRVAGGVSGLARGRLSRLHAGVYVTD